MGNAEMLNVMLASAGVESLPLDGFASVAVGLAAVAWMLNQGSQLMDRWRAARDGGTFAVNIQSKLATKDDLHDFDGRLARLDREVEQVRTTVAEHTGRIHARIDGVTEKLAELIGEVKQMNSTLGMLLAKATKGDK